MPEPREGLLPPELAQPVNSVLKFDDACKPVRRARLYACAQSFLSFPGKFRLPMQWYLEISAHGLGPSRA